MSNKADITISYKDAVMLYVDTHDDDGLFFEMREYFTFYVPNYQFMPAYRNKMWDGKYRLLDSRNKTIYAGLLYKLFEFATSRNYKIEVIPHPTLGRPTDMFDYNMEYLKSLTYVASGKIIQPYDYQYNSVERGLKFGRALILSPTASGKSLTIYMYIRHFLEYNKEGGNVLIIVPTTSLVEQMFSDFADYASMDSTFDAASLIHRIYSGMPKDQKLENRIVISTWQSLYRLPAKYFSQFQCVIGDEAHLYQAKSLCGILEKCTNAMYRMGCTGSLTESQTHQYIVEGLFGKSYVATTTKERMDAGTCAQLDIKLLTLQYSDDDKKATRKLEYKEEIDWLAQHEKRNRFIRNLTLSLKGNTIVLFRYVQKHGKILERMIREKNTDPNRKVFFVYGGVDTEDREAIRRIVEKETNAIIIASGGCFSTGISIRNLHNLVFAAPTKSQVKVIQSIGRGLRLSDNGETTVLYDIVDDLSYKRKRNWAMKHAATRLAVYDKEQFTYSIIQIPMQ